MQGTVEAHNSNLAERVTDALGNIALVQSFVRVESEVPELKRLSARLLAAQFPVLSWWAVVAVLTRASTILTLLSTVLLGSWLFQHGLVTVGEIVTFMGLASMVIVRLEQSVSFANLMTMDAPRLREFFGVLDTVPRWSISRMQSIPAVSSDGRADR
ncbi:MAG TPA: ABC transporter transmembrane domain-containing protein [Xanthobacteraceae bacterium]